ncbi:hypothetical protein PHLCEN_2v4610 [Hermanssonia centrifuga]|uniref:Uncharacterized protein n=1 Tax=Hermanssonia centrifuga TaxID=98765 RepID=A0A2R6PMR5_9APHY|nr:hypothetical protein PHLCEN_2v4610 [Hermanssonia centrifuga]
MASSSSFSASRQGDLHTLQDELNNTARTIIRLQTSFGAAIQKSEEREARLQGRIREVKAQKVAQDLEVQMLQRQNEELRRLARTQGGDSTRAGLEARVRCVTLERDDARRELKHAHKILFDLLREKKDIFSPEAARSSASQNRVLRSVSSFRDQPVESDAASSVSKAQGRAKDKSSTARLKEFTDTSFASTRMQRTHDVRKADEFVERPSTTRGKVDTSGTPVPNRQTSRGQSSTVRLEDLPGSVSTTLTPSHEAVVPDLAEEAEVEAQLAEGSSSEDAATSADETATSDGGHLTNVTYEEDYGVPEEARGRDLPPTPRSSIVVENVLSAAQPAVDGGEIQVEPEITDDDLAVNWSWTPATCPASAPFSCGPMSHAELSERLQMSEDTDGPQWWYAGKLRWHLTNRVPKWPTLDNGVILDEIATQLKAWLTKILKEKWRTGQTRREIAGLMDSGELRQLTIELRRDAELEEESRAFAQDVLRMPVVESQLE